MPTFNDIITIHSATPPTIEVDWEAGAAYIRFSRNKVAKTVSRDADDCFMTVDLDADGQVVGVEVIGSSEIRIGPMLKRAGVSAPNVDYSEVRYARPGGKLAA